MTIDKKQLIPFLKGIAEGYADQPGMQWSDYHVANLINSILERIESGEFDEVDEEDPVWTKEWEERYGVND